MIIRTRSGRTYLYTPSSNRLTAVPDEAAAAVSEETAPAVPTRYEASPEYDFSGIGMYTVEMTQQCNLRCRYCCYSGEYNDRRMHNDAAMSAENIRRCVRFIAEHTPPELPVVYVAFYGGEALLRGDGIRGMMQSLRTECPGRAFEFSISTNGLLLTDDVADWICATPDLYLTITVDGDRVMHDRHRVTSAGHGSFDTIMANLRRFRDRHPDAFSRRIRFISTVRSIADLIPLNDFWMDNDLLRDNRPQHISSIIPNPAKGERASCDTEVFTRVYDIAMDHFRAGTGDILTDELHNLVKSVERRTYRPLPDRQTIRTCMNRPEGCFISSAGELYMCERFCGSLRTGTLAGGFDRKLCGELNRRYLHRKNTYCAVCPARRLCRLCPTVLNLDDGSFMERCANERMQTALALRYFCEIKEFERGIG